MTMVCTNVYCNKCLLTKFAEDSYLIYDCIFRTFVLIILIIIINYHWKQFKRIKSTYCGFTIFYRGGLNDYFINRICYMYHFSVLGVENVMCIVSSYNTSYMIWRNFLFIIISFVELIGKGSFILSTACDIIWNKWLQFDIVSFYTLSQVSVLSINKALNNGWNQYFKILVICLLFY